jgi:probable HAF family extracellular repeat protein
MRVLPGLCVALLSGGCPLLADALYTVTDLGSGTAYSINNAGQVIGGSGHVFLYSNGQMTDLGTLEAKPVRPQPSIMQGR